MIEARLEISSLTPLSYDGVPIDGLVDIDARRQQVLLTNEGDEAFELSIGYEYRVIQIYSRPGRTLFRYVVQTVGGPLPRPTRLSDVRVAVVRFPDAAIEVHSLVTDTKATFPGRDLPLLVAALQTYLPPAGDPL